MTALTYTLVSIIYKTLTITPIILLSLSILIIILTIIIKPYYNNIRVIIN